jgi:DNA-binding transcriptional LysR family regulator
VAAGLGVAILPETMRDIHVDNVKLIRLTEAEATTTLLVAMREQGRATLEQPLMALLLKYAGQN